MPMMQMRCPHCTTFHAIGPSVPNTKAENPFWLVAQHVNAQHQSVTFLCPRRSEQVAKTMRGQRDFWCVEPNGDRTCSHCGSMSEEDLRDILAGFVANKPGFYFATTTDGDKVYAHRPGVRNSGEGGFKFHLQHLSRDDSGRSALASLFDEAIQRELKKNG